MLSVARGGEIVIGEWDGEIPPITILCQSTAPAFLQLGGQGITTAIAVPTATADVLALLSPLLPLLPVGIEGLLLRGPCRKRRHAIEIAKEIVREIVSEIGEIVSEIGEIVSEIVSEIGKEEDCNQ